MIDPLQMASNAAKLFERKVDCTSVKCSWGCDEFPELCQYIPLYALLDQEFIIQFPQIELPLSEGSIVYSVRGIFESKG